jgi:hypothetical protein
MKIRCNAAFLAAAAHFAAVQPALRRRGVLRNPDRNR